MHPGLPVLLAYVLGSIPFAYLAGRARGIDLRQHGSGNLGATNAARVLGSRVGAMVYAADTLKGFVPVFLFSRTILSSPQQRWWLLATAVAAIIGHMKPLFLLGRGGGKGVATAGGAFLGLAPVPTAVSFAAFVVVLLSTKYMSLASLTAALVLPVGVAALYGLRDPLFGATAVVALLVVWMHRSNIQRLRLGVEPRFGSRSVSGSA